MTVTIKHESSWHSLILDGDKWLATVNTARVDAEVVRKAIEDALAAKTVERG